MTNPQQPPAYCVSATGPKLDCQKILFKNDVHVVENPITLDRLSQKWILMDFCWSNLLDQTEFIHALLGTFWKYVFLSMMAVKQPTKTRETLKGFASPLLILLWVWSEISYWRVVVCTWSLSLRAFESLWNLSTRMHLTTNLECWMLMNAQLQKLHWLTYVNIVIDENYRCHLNL